MLMSLRQSLQVKDSADVILTMMATELLVATPDLVVVLISDDGECS